MEPKGERRENDFSCFLSWDAHHFLPSTLELLVLRSLDSKLMPAVPHFSGLQTQAELYHRLFLALKLADSRQQDFSASITSWANPIINLLIYMLWFYFSNAVVNPILEKYHLHLTFNELLDLS